MRMPTDGFVVWIPRIVGFEASVVRPCAMIIRSARNGRLAFAAQIWLTQSSAATTLTPVLVVPTHSRTFLAVCFQIGSDIDSC